MALTTVPVELANLDGAVTINESSADVDFRVESNGNANMLFVDAGNDVVSVGYGASIAMAGERHELEVFDTNFSTISAATFRNGSDGANITLGHSRSGTIGTQTVLQDGDTMGGINFVGSDGTDMASYGARIYVEVDGTPGSNDMPGRLIFATTADGATGSTERMRIRSDGNVGIGSAGMACLSSYTQLSIGPMAHIMAENTSGAGRSLHISQNAHLDTDSSWETMETDEASNYYQYAGGHYFRTAASTSAGTDITWLSPVTIDNVGQTTVTTSAQTSYPFKANNTHASFNGYAYQTDISRAAHQDYYFFVARSNLSVSADNEFLLRGNGEAYADGSWNSGGADYAEYFEWKDGNSDGEDRRGYPVVLDGNMIRKATSDDLASSIIGIVSTAPAIVGDSDTEQYKQKYLKDDFGSFIWEDYTVTEWDEITYGGPSESNAKTISYHTDEIPSDVTPPSEDVKNEDGQVVKTKAVVTSTDADGNNLRRKKLNPDYDSSKTYETRESRKEWEAIGLMGKLRMRKGQPTGDRWIKMRDITDSIEEWLVR